MIINKEDILSGAMNASNITNIVNIFYVDKNYGKYQKQFTTNKGDLIETDTILIDYKLEEHNIDINHFRSHTTNMTDIASNLVMSHIHSHVINYISTNQITTEYIKFYKSKYFFKNIFKKAQTKEDVLKKISSYIKQDSIILFSLSIFKEIIGEISHNAQNDSFIEAGAFDKRKCYIIPGWTEKSILIVNKNDLDVIISRKLRIEEVGDIASIIFSLSIAKTKTPIVRINLY